MGMIREPFDLGAFAAQLETRWLGRVASATSETGSTNDLAWAAAATGGASGSVFLAEHQTRGRGRSGRSWEAPPASSLLCSLLLRPAVVPSELARFTLAAAVAAALALRSSGAAVEIKWPNDLLAGRQKIGGILCESRTAASPALVAGIGINVSQERHELPSGATSLWLEVGRAVRRETLLAGILSELEPRLEAVERGELAAVLAEWAGLAPRHQGGRVRVADAGQRFEGTSLGLDALGALRVRRDDGRVASVVSGSVELL